MKIEWTEPALMDLENIRDYIKKDSEYYATRFVERIIEVVERLEKFPVSWTCACYYAFFLKLLRRRSA